MIDWISENIFSQTCGTDNIAENENAEKADDEINSMTHLNNETQLLDEDSQASSISRPSSSLNQSCDSLDVNFFYTLTQIVASNVFNSILICYSQLTWELQHQNNKSWNDFWIM